MPPLICLPAIETKGFVRQEPRKIEGYFQIYEFGSKK